jgi:hypothetical protein
MHVIISKGNCDLTFHLPTLLCFNFLWFLWNYFTLCLNFFCGQCCNTWRALIKSLWALQIIDLLTSSFFFSEYSNFVVGVSTKKNMNLNSNNLLCLNWHKLQNISSIWVHVFHFHMGICFHVPSLQSKTLKT